MDNLSYILFICVVAPLLSMLLLVEGRARRTVGFIIGGMFICLFVSEVNGLLLNMIDCSTYYFTTAVTPVTEEIAKAIPVFLFGFICSDKKKDLVPVSFSIGIGFAVLENLIIFAQNFESVNLLWALIRGFSSGLMHGMCAAIAGCCVSFVHKKKKLFFCGSLAALNLVMVYHSMFNSLVQAENLILNIIGFSLPMLTYIVFILVLIKIKGYKGRAKKTE